MNSYNNSNSSFPPACRTGGDDEGRCGNDAISVEPLCPVFGVCGGCAYQDIAYEEELGLKENLLKELFWKELELEDSIFQPVVPSPAPYHYRTRLDLTFKRGRKGILEFGFQNFNGRKIIPVDACAIARPEISESISRIKEEALAKLPADYRTANLVIRTGASGRVLWGGIGRRSLVMDPKDYFWAEIQGKKIFYSLETFFQANHSILPRLMEVISRLAHFDKETTLLDLYGGAGLFGITFADQVGKVILIEEHPGSIKLAAFNRDYHQLKNFEIRQGRVEDIFDEFLVSFLRRVNSSSPHVFRRGSSVVDSRLTACGNDERSVRGKDTKRVAIADPPRKGLGPAAREALSSAQNLKSFFYLSCNPESLVEDLKVFLAKGWQIRQVIPFDFFPKTRHLEVLAWLKSAV